MNLLPLLPEEKISSVIKVADFDDAKYIVMVTKNGTIKRSELSLYSRIRKSGVIGITLDEGDELAWARLTGGDDHLIVATRGGMSIRFAETDARCMGRSARGVRAIALKEGDEVVGMSVVQPGAKLLTVTEEGKGRLTDMEEYRPQQRGGQGIRNYDCSKGAVVAGVRAVMEDDDDAILISQNGTLIRIHVSDIATQSRYGGGVRVMRLDEGDSVVTLACAEREDEEEEGAVSPLPADEGEAEDTAAAEMPAETENEEE